MISEKLKNRIQVVPGDITKLGCGGVDGTIHRAAGPELLADCYRNSLNLAQEYDIHSIAFPAISAGAYGYPLEDATELAVKAVAQWLEAHADYAMQVIFWL